MEEGGEGRGSETKAEDEGSLHRCVSVPREFFKIFTGLVRDHGY